MIDCLFSLLVVVVVAVVVVVVVELFLLFLQVVAAAADCDSHLCWGSGDFFVPREKRSQRCGHLLAWPRTHWVHGVIQ